MSNEPIEKDKHITVVVMFTRYTHTCNYELLAPYFRRGIVFKVLLCTYVFSSANINANINVCTSASTSIGSSSSVV